MRKYMGYFDLQVATSHSCSVARWSSAPARQYYIYSLQVQNYMCEWDYIKVKSEHSSLFCPPKIFATHCMYSD